VTRTFLNLLVPTGVATHPALFGLPPDALNVPRYNRPVTRTSAKAPALASASRGTNGANGSAKDSTDNDALADDGASEDTSAVATAGETEE
jgi:hypothetical protein